MLYTGNTLNKRSTYEAQSYIIHITREVLYQGRSSIRSSYEVQSYTIHKTRDVRYEVWPIRYTVKTREVRYELLAWPI